MKTTRDLIVNLLRKKGLYKRCLEERAKSIWSDVVGEKISAHTNVLRVEEGVLFVGVDASTWCNELTFLKTKIKNKINSQIGEEVIKDIRFRTG